MKGRQPSNGTAKSGKALDVYAALITGQEISRSNPDTRDLYEEFYANAAVYDIVTKMMKN